MLETLPGFAWGKGASDGVSTLALEDDLALIADTRDKADILLKVAVRFYQDAGLQLNVSKCAALRFRKGKGVSAQVTRSMKQALGRLERASYSGIWGGGAG